MFNPTLTTRLEIDGEAFSFSPHPVVPSIPWGQEGRHAIVYRVQNRGQGYALKVFRPAFRHPGLVDAAQSISLYHELPGMRVCKQIVLTPETYPGLLAQYEDLDHAMLMPWIDGQTWFDLLQLKNRFSLDRSRALAESMAWVLYALEYNHLAHCDLSSGNVIVDPDMVQIHLIDVEDLYSPWLVPPPFISYGSMGYQHKRAARAGQWGPLGDRFAGAVLVAEMLGWAHPEVRQRAWGESYFAPDELQKDGERYRLLVEAIRIYDPGFAEAFEQAWRSTSLETCPPLKTWYDLLDKLPRDPVANWAPIDPRLYKEVEPAFQSQGVTPSVPASGQPKSDKADRDGQRERQRSNRRGCVRAFAITLMVFSVLCCYAGVFLAQLQFLMEN